MAVGGYDILLAQRVLLHEQVVSSPLHPYACGQGASVVADISEGIHIAFLVQPAAQAHLLLHLHTLYSADAKHFVLGTFQFEGPHILFIFA